jgi:glycosyltransferase involved in cell wall biosynthesis
MLVRPVLSPSPCLSVIVPCYNEAATIKELLDRVLASPFTQEVVVVDDGSRDDSVEIASSTGDARVRVVVQPHNLEYDPHDYAKLVPPILDGRADVVYGSRFAGEGERRVLLFWHSLGNRLLTLMSNMLTDLNLTDMETCYKAFRREIIQSIDLCEDRFGFEPEVTAKLAKTGCRIYEVGISYNGRTYAEGKKIGWKDGVRAIWCMLRYSKLLSRG